MLAADHADDDVWYKFVAVNQTITITLSGIKKGNGNLGNATPTLELFSGSCGSLVSLACDKSNPNSITYSALTTGVTYYIRVYSGASGFPASDANFNICITHGVPPANDDCNGATMLTVGTTSSGSVWNATANSSIPAGCATGIPNDDVWYKFVATSTTATVTLSNLGVSLSSAGTAVQLFSGTCGSLTSLGCGTTSLTSTGLMTSPATTYYIRVYTTGSGNLANSSNFDITVNSPSTPPVNDDCGAATALTIGSASSGTVWAATDSGLPTVCSGNPDDDVWYKITTSTFSNSLTVNLASIGTDLNASGARIQIFTGACGSLTSYACGSSTLTTPVSGNTTYYIRVYSAGTGSIASASGSTFSITATISGPTVVTAGRNNEVFKQTILSGSGVSAISMGNYLWSR